jgi:toxin ParE1/3/4
VKPFRIHAAAKAEVQGAIAHYESQRVGLGREFRQEFEAALNRIRRLPRATAPIADRGTRKHRLTRFPYAVYYIEHDASI